MSTRQQRRANRRNALQPPAPKREALIPHPQSPPLTPAFPAPVPRPPAAPSLKSGLDAKSQSVPGESPEEFAQLQAEYSARFAPTTPEQRFLVDCLIRNEWLLRRLFRVEAQFWEYHAMQATRSSGVPLGEAFSQTSTIFLRLRRQVAAAEKSYKEAMAELERLQAAAQPPQSTGETQQLASFRETRDRDRPVPSNPPPDNSPIVEFQTCIP
jgi:hypothetical protein